MLSVGYQIAEAITAHNRRVDASEAQATRDRAPRARRRPATPEQRFDQYPHEFSGGMRQRGMIAMAIANSPSVLIADEPTTALDVTIQAQIIEVLRDGSSARRNAATILITHDLGVIAELADRVVVMYGGRVVELGDVYTIFNSPVGIRTPSG